jgi:glycerol-3-phosphate dehydrogenase
MKNFSFETRTENITKLKSEKFDLLVIGGGITGAGVARDASMRGLKVGLIESNDFAFGTSSRSSKLVHGGIRYLENKEFHLVFEALSERTKLFEIAPHLVHPLRFMIPLYKSSRVGMFLMGLGMMLYDALALFQAPELHERLSADESKARMPILNSKDLLGSYVYSDAYMDDDRLVHETLRSANEHNAICVNYVKASKSKLENNKISSIEVIDQITNEKFEVKAHHVISTVGPWTDLVGENFVTDWKKILRPTKGIHLTFSKERIPLSSAVVMAAEKSTRIVFAIPRHEMVIVGTTDTDFTGNPTDAKVTAEDVTYLLGFANQYFPGADLKPQDIISSYVGVRPLVKDESDNEGKTSREHTIKHDDRGFTFVAGGKYTTYRLMSEQIVDQCLKFFPFEKKSMLSKCETQKSLNKYTTPDEFENAVQYANSELEKKLAERYGAEAKIILDRFGYTDNYWQLEAYQAIHTTMCLNLTDFYSRRVPLVLAEKDHGLSKINDIAEIFKSELKLSAQQIESQKTDLKNYLEIELGWRKSFNCEYLST